MKIASTIAMLATPAFAEPFTPDDRTMDRIVQCIERGGEKEECIETEKDRLCEEAVEGMPHILDQLDRGVPIYRLTGKEVSIYAVKQMVEEPMFFAIPRALLFTSFLEGCQE